MKTIEKKEPYLNILDTQGNIYEEFLPDQVLTHKSLNKVVNYFEDQDRLSRIYLIGVGIGCGMNIVSYSEGKIIIAQGAGITTDGDIIKTETRTFQYYTELTDRAAYALFEGRKIYEMYAQEEAGLGLRTHEHPLTSFNSNETGTLKDYIVIAYVENYTEDEGLCGGSGCDETGNKVYSNIKFLLTHKSNYNHLISGDTIYKSHDVLKYYDSLPELCMPRLLLTKANTTSGISIHDQFKNSFFLKTELFVGITTIINRFEPRINLARYGVSISEITTYFNTIFNVQQEQFIQYKYDLLKDLIDTYREIRELILHTRFECVPNIKAFPKHLLLGTLEEQTRLQTRHNFYPSPTVSENDENLLSIRALCIKFFNQLKEYKIPNVPTAAIKITPSKSYEFKLSERTIPYYYETKNSLISNWNPISIQQRKPKNQLGYHVSKLKDIPCIQEPLKFSHLDKDFYRIEGHIGKDFRLALRRINNLKATYNLAFDVKTISIGFPVNKITLDDDKCDTKDYSILLKTWEREFCCTAESAMEFFQKYQFDDLGGNDTSTAVYSVAVLQKEKLEKTNPEKRSAKALNTNASTESTKAQARYETSLQYAIDQAYIHIGTQNAAAGYLTSVALEIIEQSLGTVDKNDDYFFYTESPVKIITGLAEIKRNFLQSLNEIYNTEKWTALNNAIDKLCTDIDQILFAISQAGDNSVFGTKTHDKMYEYFIYDLSKICCLKGRFTWLKEQVDDIRNNLYRELILSRLIEKHPGIEHMAGVPKGGTFLMVYLGGTESLLDDAGTIERQFNGVVQFDFALPYMCCSDCPPETIVYNSPVAETTLIIAKTKYCLPTDEGLVDFVTGSTNDIVTSPEGDAYIVPTDAGYAFDPTLVPDNLLGEVLTFLVDGEMPTVPVEICVFKFPSDVIASYEFSLWNDEGILLNLNVAHEFDTFSYFTYTWIREDGSEIGTEKDVLDAFFANPENSFVETFKLVIAVEAYPLGCTDSYEVPVDESRPEDNDVEVPEIICHNLEETSPAWVPVIVTPAGSTLTSPEDVTPSFIEINDKGNYFIDPVKVPDALVGEQITFAVDGTPVPSKFTRIGRLPSFINTDDGGNAIQPYQVVGWDDAGVKVDIVAMHDYQSETYIEYRWVNSDTDEAIGATRLVSGVFIPASESATANFSVEMRVIGLEESCTTSFNVGFTIPRPTLDIPTGICFGESIVLDVSPDDTITTSVDNNIIQNISDIITLESGLVQNSDVGQPIDVFINGSLAASTTVYKVPEISNITAADEFVSWDGDDVIVNLVVNYTVPGVTNPENYLEVKWFDDTGNPVNVTANHGITSVDGSVDKTYKVTVSVNPALMDITPCETDSVDVIIRETRPVTEPILPTTFDLNNEYCWEDGSPDLIIPVSVSPTNFTITSPQGDVFIQDDGSSYTFVLSNVPDTALGNLIEFQIDGNTIDSTTVYKTPKPESILHDEVNSQWIPGGYQFTFRHDYDEHDYFRYNVVDERTGQTLIPVAGSADIFRIGADGLVNERFEVTIFLNGLDCTSGPAQVTVTDTNPNPTEPTIPIDPTIPTNPTGPTSPLGRLVCTTPYTERLDILGVNDELNRLNEKFGGKPYESNIKKNILTPIRDSVVAISASKNLNTDSLELIGQLNTTRAELENNFLKNPNIGTDKNLFLNVDEVLELMSLELLRCVDNDTAASLMTSVTNTSTVRNIDYSDDGGSRTKITDNYLSTFNDKGDLFNNTIDTTFSTRTR